MSDPTQTLIAELEAEAEFVAVGAFTIDLTAAGEKLRMYRMADPEAFVLLVVEAAHMFPGCTAVVFEVGAQRTRIELRGVALEEAELRGFLDVISASLVDLDDDATARSQGRQLLALAAVSAGQLERGTLTIGSSRTACVVEVADDGGFELGSEPVSATTEHTWLRLDEGGGLSRRFGSGAEAIEHRRALLVDRCRYAWVPVWLDGRPISSGFTLPDVERPYALRKPDRTALAVFGQSPARRRATFLLVANGVVQETLVDEALDPSVVALVQASDLPRDLSMAKFRRDQNFEHLLDQVRTAVRSLNFESMNSLVQVKPVEDETINMVSAAALGLVIGVGVSTTIAAPLLLLAAWEAGVLTRRGLVRWRGRAVHATVLRVWWWPPVTVWRMMIGCRRYRLKLRVTPPGEPAVTARCVVVSEIRFHPGMRVTVRYDPAWPRLVVLDQTG